MVVGCPKCKAKLKIPEEKIKPEGTKFKCPKCRAMLLVKKPAAKAAAPPPPPPRAKAPAEAPSAGKAPSMEPPSERPETSERMEWPAPPEEEPPVGREPWPDFPPEPSAEREPQAEMPAAPPAWPEVPEAPAPPPPPSFEEEPAPAPAPVSEEPLPPPRMEPAVETPAPPVEPPVEEAARKAPPEVEEKAGPEAQKVLLAHPDPQTVNMLKFVLMGANFSVTSATDGVQAMVKALKEMPAVIVADVRLPKIHGIEMMKRLRSRAETKDIGVILTGSKPEAEVPRIPGAAGYIQEDRMQQGLVPLIKKTLAAPPSPPVAAPAAAGPAAAPPRPAAPPSDAGVQRAQRFARTVLSDIDLYNKGKVEQSIRQGDFEGAFSKELQEGRKLYEMRIPEDVRRKGNFFDDAVREFIEKKKRQFGI